jgi:endonuclease/exonuclease/phosphatase family metal-dependent hydrolase
MQIISYNIQFGRGLDRKIDMSRVCDSIRGADIICLQEVDVGWKRSGDANQPEIISSLLPEYYFVYGSSFNVDISEKQTDGKIFNRRRQHGNMVLSKSPIVSSRTINLPKKFYASKFNMHMSCVETVVEIGSRFARVYSYHAGYLESSERLLQISHFIEHYNMAPIEGAAWDGKGDIDHDDWSNHNSMPEMPIAAIVCGDFNCSADTPEYKLLLENSDLVDCWKLVDQQNMNTTTLKNDQTEDIKVSGKIDHIFVSGSLTDYVRQVEIDHQAQGSDHCPVHCNIDF